MRNLLALALLIFCPAFAADSDFNGRWDITIPGPVGRAWWLQVDGAGTPAPKVKFISAYAGDLNVTDEVSVKGGELTFGFRFKQSARQGEKPRDVHSVYKARPGTLLYQPVGIIPNKDVMKIVASFMRNGFIGHLGVGHNQSRRGEKVILEGVQEKGIGHRQAPKTHGQGRP